MLRRCRSNYELYNASVARGWLCTDLKNQLLYPKSIILYPKLFIFVVSLTYEMRKQHTKKEKHYNSLPLSRYLLYCSLHIRVILSTNRYILGQVIHVFVLLFVYPAWHPGRIFIKESLWALKFYDLFIVVYSTLVHNINILYLFGLLKVKQKSWI